MASKNIETNLMCSNCEDVIPFDNMFKCVTCSDAVTDPIPPLAVFCDGCVISHIKKSHKINDNRGFEPSVCKDHKQLCSEFCKTCKKLCCVKCLRDHIKHEFEPLKKKASEVRAKVFEALTQWELNEKPARAKKELVSATLVSRREDAEKLIDYVEQKIEESKTKIVLEIRSKLIGVENSEEYVDAHVKKVVDLQRDLRNLLQSSEGVMVESFPRTLVQIEICSSLQKQIEALNFDGVNEIADIGSLDADFEKFLDKIKVQFESACEEKKKSVVSCNAGSTKYKKRRYLFNLRDDDDLAIEIEIQPNGYSIQKCVIDSGANLVNANIVTNLGLNSVEYVYCISGWWILLLFVDKSVCILWANDGTKMKKIDVSYPSMPHYLTPFVVGKNVEWVFWDASDKTLRSTMALFKIPCASKPTNMLHSFIDRFVYFEADKKDVIVVERCPIHSDVDIIPFSVHHLNFIDCISCGELDLKSTTGVYVILWSKESNLAKILSKSGGGWAVKESIRLSPLPTCYSSTIRQYLIPKVFCTSKKIYVYAFLVFKDLISEECLTDSKY